MIIKTEAAKSSSLRIEGTSTLHGWDVEAKEFYVNVSISESCFGDNSSWNESDIEHVEVTVPVNKLDGGRSRMNRDLRKALRFEDYRDIKFTGDKLTIQSSDDGHKSARVTGNLSIGGVTREINFIADLRLNEEDKIEVSGRVKINMKDYEIDPPRALLGTLRTGEIIQLVFDLILQEKE